MSVSVKKHQLSTGPLCSDVKSNYDIIILTAYLRMDWVREPTGSAYIDSIKEMKKPGVKCVFS